jgi:hypothetical protein
VTTQPDATPGDGPSARQVTKPLRELVALVLLGANALLLFVGLIDLFVPFSDSSTFTGRAGGSFFDFAGIEGIVLPILAVLLATHIAPPVARAKLITQVALIEYAVSAVFAAVAFLAWLFGALADGELRSAFTGTLVRIAYAAIFLSVAFLVYKVWRAHYYVPKPKPQRQQPGVYGQPSYPPQQGYPQPGQPYPGYQQQPPPGAYGQQPPAAPTSGGGYPPAPGYPPYQQQQPPYGQQEQPPSAYQQQPPSYGQQPPSYGQQPPAAPPAPPAETQVAGPYTMPSAQPTPPTAPSSGPPAPSSAPPAADATELIPQDTDRTQLINPESQRPTAGGTPPPTRDGEEPTEPGR